MHDDDRQLVARLRAGDEAEFRRFFEEYFERLYRFAMSRTRGDADLSEEAVQRALCRAVRRLEQYRGDAALFSWLAQICRNELADLLEARQRTAARSPSYDADAATRERAENVPAGEGSDPAAGEQSRSRAALVREVLDGLPGRYGEVLEWKYLEELGVEDIAARLRTSFEAAQSLLARARGAFRSALAARGHDLDTLL